VTAAVDQSLPERYFDPWHERFEALMAPELVHGVSILDVGAGRQATLPRARRPTGCCYVGLDVSLDELAAAPAGDYDEIVVGNIAAPMPELDERFDLVVSWQALEHVRPLSAAFDNMRRYLRPGGLLLVQISGRYAFFALLGRLLPHRVGTWGMQRFLDRDPESVFPAFYDDCTYDRLTQLLEPWSEREIVPLYCGGGYLGFSRLLQRPYLRYENWTARHDHRNLATHYLVSARR
jgi:SAM-dependent methyltransferase